MIDGIVMKGKRIIIPFQLQKHTATAAQQPYWDRKDTIM